MSDKAQIAEAVQKHLEKGDWKSAIAEMERLFALDRDPQVRVRIGDARQKLNQKAEAVKEYTRAADLFADKGFVVKALALYKLALRLDPANAAQQKIEALHAHASVAEKRAEPVEAGTPEPSRSVIPLFADLTQEEFNDFTKRLVARTVPPNAPILREGEGGNSVYVITRGSVRVFTTVQGRNVDLAVLGPSDFFGEIAFLTGRPRTATVEAREETDLLELPEPELIDLIAKRPRVRDVMMKFYEERVQSTIEKVKGMA